MSSKRLLVVMDVAVGSTTAQVRGWRFEPWFRRAGWVAQFVDVADASRDEIIELSRAVDIVYLVKTRNIHLLREIKRQSSAVVVFDLTDALWLGSNRSAWSDIELIIAEADVIFSENGWVCDFARHLNGRVVSIPVCTLVEQFDELRRTEPALMKRGKDITIGWIGSQITTTALKKLRPVLEEISAAHPEVVLRFVGVGKVDFGDWRARVIAIPTYDELQMVREILQMDIGIFPPPRDLKEYAIRGAQKAMLYMTGGAVPVTQNAGDATRILTQGVTGFLADTHEDWYAHLETLISDPARRARMASSAQQAMSGRTLRSVFETLERSLLEARKPETPDRIKNVRAHAEMFARNAFYRVSLLGERARRRLGHVMRQS